MRFLNNVVQLIDSDFCASASFGDLNLFARVLTLAIVSANIGLTYCV